MSTVAHPNTDRWSNRMDRDANQQQDSSSISILGLLSSGLSRRSFNFCGQKDSRFAKLNSGNEMIAVPTAGMYQTYRHLTVVQGSPGPTTLSPSGGTSCTINASAASVTMAM